jgi:hypothetical protein
VPRCRETRSIDHFVTQHKLLIVLSSKTARPAGTSPPYYSQHPARRRLSGGQRGREAAVVHAAEHVPVVPVDGEGVVDLAVAAPLVLEQQRRVVERRELHEPEVAIAEDAPLGDRRRVVRQVAAAAAGHHEDGAVHRPRVVALLVGHAPALLVALQGKCRLIRVVRNRKNYSFHAWITW